MEKERAAADVATRSRLCLLFVCLLSVRLRPQMSTTAPKHPASPNVDEPQAKRTEIGKGAQ